MRIASWLTAALAGLLLAGCAGMQPAAPSAEVRAALAPSGTLRVAFVTALIYASKDPATGELKGMAVDMGRELARRAGLAFHPVAYSGFPALIAGAKSGEWDVAFAGVTPERAAVIDYAEPYMVIEQGYLVRAGVRASTMDDVDVAGLRVGVIEKGAADGLLSRTLKNATLVRAASITELYGLIGSGKADVIATGKTGLYTVAEKEPGSRVLDGRLLVETAAMGVPKGRNPAGVAYLTRFTEEAKAEGLVQQAIERARLRGVSVAPGK